MKVLIVDSEESRSKGMVRYLEDESCETQSFTDASMALGHMELHHTQLVFVELKSVEGDVLEFLKQVRLLSPRTEVIVFSPTASLNDVVAAMEVGALTYLQTPLIPEELKAVLLRVSERLRLRQENEQMRSLLAQEITPFELISESPVMRQVSLHLQRAAPLGIPILLSGEVGTGKDELARQVHRLSGVSGRFVTQHCSGQDRQALESELFGHVKGAFSGAVIDRPGRIEYAEGGTLYMDEIADLSLESQSRFARVLDSGEFIRVGSVEPVRCQFRLVASTTCDLEELVEKGAFREDLYMHLKEMHVHLPPLRERLEDFELLVNHFMRELSHQHRLPFKAHNFRTLSRLKVEGWPGNLRELRARLSRSLIIPEEDPPPLPHPDKGVTLEEMEKILIRDTLKRLKGNRRLVADSLGIAERTLYRKIRQHGL